MAYYYPNLYSPQQHAPQPAAMIQVPDEISARNAQFSLDGSISYFTNGIEIYSKQISMADGSLIFKKYILDQPQPSPKPNYATLEDLQALEKKIYDMVGGPG